MKDKVFVELVEKHRHEFFTFARRTVWDKENAEDAFCAAVAAGYEDRHTYRPGTNFRAWMYKILANKCFIANRETDRAAVNIEVVDEQYLAQENNSTIEISRYPDDLVHECGDEVVEALAKLRPIERSCFLLLSLGGCSYKEIAEIIEVPLGTVVTHLVRGRAKLRRWLCDYATEWGMRHSVIPVTDPVPETKGGNDA
jgi:RNA polymerase sigma-70 factor (ECF subfamily)